jgi:PAS domain S-box-containing protein
VALRAPSGHALGALCVIDPQPRTGFTTQDRTRLMQLAAMVADRLELRRMEVASASMRPGGFAATAIGSPSAILSCDDRACLTDCNAAAAQMFGWGERELIGTSLEDLIADADRARVHDGIRRVLQGDVPITEGTLLTALRRDGTRFDAELHWSRWHEGARVYFGVIIRDLSATQSEQDALYQLANFDPSPNCPTATCCCAIWMRRLAMATALRWCWSIWTGFTTSTPRWAGGGRPCAAPCGQPHPWRRAHGGADRAARRGQVRRADAVARSRRGGAGGAWDQ